MRWGGVDAAAVHRLAPAELHDRQGQRAPAAPTNDPYNLLVDSFSTWWLTLIYLVAMAMLGAHLHHGIWSSMQTLGLTNTARARARAKRVGVHARRDHRRRLLARPGLRPRRRHRRSKATAPMTDMPDTTLTERPVAPTAPTQETDDAAGYYTPGRPDRRHQGPGGPIDGALGHPPVRGPHRQPGQPPPALGDRRRHRPGRRVRRGHARRGRLRREVLLLPGLPAPGALDRRPGRHQRGQELQGRRRLGLPALLRHHQGRRLPLARVERLPPGPGEPEHHRPVRRPGRAVRPRVRRPAGQPLLRRPCRSRAPSTRAARPASSC